MSLNYKQKERFSGLLTLHDRYNNWVLDLLTADRKRLSEIKKRRPPQPFLSRVTLETQELLDEDYLLEFEAKNRELLELGAKVLKCEDPNQLQSLRIEFSKSYQSFLYDAQAIKKAAFYMENGYDEISELKMVKTMVKDLEMEMQKLSRQGQAFCIALAGIDNYEQLKGKYDKTVLNDAINAAGRAMIECLRPLDDAYYAAENEFVLCLRQTDMTGGVHAFKRFKDYLDKFTDEAKERHADFPEITMSCCVAEPVVGNEIDDLLENLRLDLKSLDKDASGSAFTYHEMSPLQRFIQSQ